MKRLIMVAAMVLMAGQAWGVEWREIERNESFTILMDYDTLKFNDRRTEISFWLKNIYTKEYSKKISPPKKPASHSIQKFTADCASETLYSAEFHLYGKNGVLVLSENKYEKMAMIPGSINEYVFQTACGVLSSVRAKEEAAAAKQRADERAAEQARLKDEAEQDRIAEAAEQERLKQEEKAKKEAAIKTEGLVVTTANEIRHNGKVIFTDKEATDLNEIKRFSIANKNMLLVKMDYKSAECDQKYKFFVEYSHGTVTASDAFGDCRPIGRMTTKGDGVEMEFEGKGLPKQKMYFDGSEVSQVAASGRKAKKAKKGLLDIFN